MPDFLVVKMGFDFLFLNYTNRTTMKTYTVKIQYLVLLLISILSCYSSPLKAEYFFKNINTDKGLSNNSVNGIFRDHQGYLWIGTSYGLNRYDGYNIRVFKNDASKSNTLTNNYVRAVVQDVDGRLWVSTSGGYTIFDYKNESFNNNIQLILKNEFNINSSSLFNVICGKKHSVFIGDQNYAYSYNHGSKSVVKVGGEKCAIAFQSGSFDSKDNLWLMDSNYKLYRVDANTGRLIKVYNEMKEMRSAGGSFVYCDRRDNLWVTLNSQKLIFFNTKTGQSFNFSNHNQGEPFNNYPIRSIVEDNAKKIWIGTDHGGLCLLDPFTFKTEVIQEKENSDYSLSENTITALFSDLDGVIWIGTFKQGVDYYHASTRRFKTLRITGPSSNKDVNCFTEDREGNLWIGTNGRGLFKFIKKTNEYKPIDYCAKTGRDNTVVSLLTDSKGRIWIGTFMDGLYCYDGKKFKHFVYLANSPSASDNSIWSILEDASGAIWVGTLNRSIYQLDEVSSTFAPMKNQSNPNSCVECAYRDRQNDLWFGGSSGITILSPNGKLKRNFRFDGKQDQSNERNYFNSITQDKKGYFWLATQSGLAILDKKDFKYHFLTTEEGLDNKFIFMVLVDSNNQIWVSTLSGIYMIKVLDYGDLDNLKADIVHFDKEDGLQDNKFNNKSAYYTQDKRLIFGGINGYNVIDPSKLQLQKNDPKLVFTNLIINNKQVSIGEEINGRVLLENSFNYTRRITLKYNENTIGVGFSALNFLFPEKYKYEYQLEGLDDKWITVDGASPVAIYNNLSRGNYTLNVRVKENGELQKDKMISLDIEVLPPFWLSWPAYLFYFALIMALVIFVYRFLIERATFRIRIRQETQEKKHIEEISAMKVKFFTNLSHELRTPVSLIILPVENMIMKCTDPVVKNNLTMVLRNAKRLLFIVNQLLDFRKLEVGEITYHPATGNIVRFIEDVTLPFLDIAQNKNIKLTVQSNLEELYTSFDPNKLERILFNLLSNAFKFTGNHGAINVSVMYEESRVLPIIIKVSDTGIGIEKEKLPYVFRPFYQADTKSGIANMGTGIGLSITYEFVQLHNGKIDVESEINKGTVFTIELPMNEKVSPSEAGVQFDSMEVVTLNDNSKSVSTNLNNKKKKTILIVDDNDDFRFYLVENLRGIYNVIDANNGAVGYEKAIRFNPDIIVSDVTMPEMNGYEFCTKLKTEMNTSHIPVVLLTANTLDEDKIAGFEAGADEFITKPFNVEVLHARLQNLLAKMDERRSQVRGQMDSNLSDVKLPTLDEKLLEKVIKIVNEKRSDSDFGIEELSKMVGMSSVYLNKKMTALTGKTTSEYVRSIRLKHAAHLLEHSDLTISEITYEVGYNSPKYFSKYFKDEFGILPTEYRKNFL